MVLPIRPSVLTITENRTFEQFIKWLLCERDFIVRTVSTAGAPLALEATEPNAVLLEAAPSIAFTAATVQRLRKIAYNVPIITLGANESPYEIEYLQQSGADDHLAAHERWNLVQSIRRHLRMVSAYSNSSMRFPLVELDESRMRAVLRGLPIWLSIVEYELLAHLMRRPYCIVSATELLQEIRQRHQAVAAQTIRSSIHQLRRKLEDDPRRPRRVVTVLGNGYVFRPDV